MLYTMFTIIYQRKTQCQRLQGLILVQFFSEKSNVWLDWLEADQPMHLAINKFNVKILLCTLLHIIVYFSECIYCYVNMFIITRIKGTAKSGSASSLDSLSRLESPLD